MLGLLGSGRKQQIELGVQGVAQKQLDDDLAARAAREPAQAASSSFVGAPTELLAKLLQQCPL